MICLYLILYLYLYIGFVIFNNNCTDNKNEAFELITLFINNTKPYLHDANTYITVIIFKFYFNNIHYN